MFATPGNHDWYDGLVSFLRLFCANQWIGGWRTRQRRSYFALKLPNDWWIWAIDIQLDTYLDDVQLQYFTDLKIGPGDKVILLTAKPSWIAAIDGRVEPPTWKYLNFFEERMVRDAGARLVVTLTGDRHHYARYEPEGAGRGRWRRRGSPRAAAAPTCRATHTLPERVELKPLPRKQDDDYVDQPAVVNRREAIYPVDKDSRRLSNGILKLAALNPAFGRLLGALYVLIGIAMLERARTGVDSAVAVSVRSGTQGGGYRDPRHREQRELLRTSSRTPSARMTIVLGAAAARRGHRQRRHQAEPAAALRGRDRAHGSCTCSSIGARHVARGRTSRRTSGTR